MKAIKRDKTGELVDVKMDEVGEAANRYVDIIEDINDLDEAKELRTINLVEALRRAGRREISVRGYHLKIKNVDAKVNISIKKPKTDE